MSQQINLYDAALLRKRELLTATNLAAAAGIVLLVVGAWGAAIRAQLVRAEAESRVLSPLVKGLQDELVAISNQVSNMRPDPRLEADLAATRERLQLRREVVAALKKGMGEEAPSFSEYLRGFARQAPKGLWLTGFRIGSGGASMEIRGRMLNPSLLPDYIARLNDEKAFRGRAFSALKISTGKLETAEDGSGAPATASPAPAGGAAAGTTRQTAGVPPPFLEFTLTPAPVAGETPSEQASGQSPASQENVR